MLTESTFLVYAANRYDNLHCTDITEFEEDLKRFQYLRKLFSRYKQYNELKERLILNHLIIIYNCFGINATNMLFLKLDGFHDVLKPFIEYLNFLPDKVEYNGIILYTNKIPSDITIKQKLGEI
jgi:hypothetical protein